MTSQSSQPAAGQYELSHLRVLEAEAIHIIREVAAEFERPVLLFSGGKDSIVMLHLAIKAFAPGRLPFPVMHVDTGHNFDEVISTRDRLVAEHGVRLVVASVEEDIAAKRVVDNGPLRNPLQTVTLLRGIRENKFDAAFGGARRDEEKARAKERVFSFRDESASGIPRCNAPTVEPVQRSSSQGRAHPGLPAVELDRVRHLGLYRRRRHHPARHLLRTHPAGVPGDGMLLAVHEFLLLTPTKKCSKPRCASAPSEVTCTGCVESVAATVDSDRRNRALADRARATAPMTGSLRPVWKTASGKATSDGNAPTTGDGRIRRRRQVHPDRPAAL